MRVLLKSLAATIAWKLAAMLALTLGFGLTIASDLAQAQQAPASYVRNRGNPTLFLNNTSSIPAAAMLGADGTSAAWVLEPVPGEPAFVRIQNVQSTLYLHTQNGIPELGIVIPGSSGWQVEPVEGKLFVRIKSATTGLYLALQEVTGPLGLVPLDIDGAAASPPPPATAEWEFIAAVAASAGVQAPIPLAAIAPVEFAIVAPFMAPTIISGVRSCGGGTIFFRGACVCPRDTVNIGGRCRLARFACNGGDNLGGECICPGGLFAVQTGPRELSCVRLAGPPADILAAPPLGIGGLGIADAGECNDIFLACDRAGEPLRSCRASRQSCLTRKQSAATDAVALGNAAAAAIAAALSKAAADAVAAQQAATIATAAQKTAADAAAKLKADADAAAALKAVADAAAAQKVAADAAAAQKTATAAAAKLKADADAAAKLKVDADAAKLAADVAAADAAVKKTAADAAVAVKLKADADAAQKTATDAAAKLKADADAAAVLKAAAIPPGPPAIKPVILGVAIIVD